MTLVDTTVWIDFFRGTESPQVSTLQAMIEGSEDVCLCGVVLTEVLQGIRREREYVAVASTFDAFLYLPMARHTFVRAANRYRSLGRQGVTVRNAVDCMIAAVAIEHDVALLYNECDFDHIASCSALKIMQA